MRDILRLVPRLSDDARVDTIGGHDGRHVIPHGGYSEPSPPSAAASPVGHASPSAVQQTPTQQVAPPEESAMSPDMESAIADAAERKRKRDAKGQPPGGHSRGGVTAAKAIRLGYRALGPRMGWGRFLSDRYSSREGQVIEGDEGRVACLVAIKAWVCTQRATATAASNRRGFNSCGGSVERRTRAVRRTGEEPDRAGRGIGGAAQERRMSGAPERDRACGGRPASPQ